MIPKPIKQITAADMQALLDSGVQEQRTLDYKLILPGGSNEAKKEFLADVCSFANAAGGDLVYGVEEKDGKPINIPGLDDLKEEDECLRLENMIRDGISPRIAGIQIRSIPRVPDKPVMVLRVPKSWRAPHMVSYNKSSRFYSRYSAGKFQMDVVEIRSAFEGAAGLPERIRQWRDDRVSRIFQGDAPVPLPQGSTLVLHLVPLDSFGDELRFSIEQLHEQGIAPLGSSGWNTRINLDGLLSYSGQTEEGMYRSYTQMFRSGRVEGVWAHVTSQRQGGPRIASVSYEEETIRTVSTSLKVLRALGVEVPIVVSLALLHAKGACMATSARFAEVYQYPIDRNALVLPDVMIESWDCKVPQVLRPVFDSVWNACGFPRSMNYDEKGNWSPQR